MFYSKSIFSFHNPLPAILIGKIETSQQEDIECMLRLRSSIETSLEWFELYLFENPNIKNFFEINDFYNENIDKLFTFDNRSQFYQFVKSDEFLRIIHAMILFKFSSMKSYDYIIKDYISVIKENEKWKFLDNIKKDEIIMAFCFMIECDLQILNFKTEEKKIFKEENKEKSKICILFSEEKYQIILRNKENFGIDRSNYEILEKNNLILIKFKLNKDEKDKIINERLNENLNKNEKDKIINDILNNKEDIQNDHYEIIKLGMNHKEKCDFCKDFIKELRLYKLKCNEEKYNKFRFLCTECFRLLVKMKLLTDIESTGKREYSIDCFNKNTCTINNAGRIEFYKRELQKIFVENEINDIDDHREKLKKLKKENNNKKNFCNICYQEDHSQLVCEFIHRIFHFVLDKLTVCFFCFSFNPRKIGSDITKCMHCDLDYCTNCMQLQLSIEFHGKEKMHSSECKFSKFKAKDSKKSTKDCTICEIKSSICNKMKNRSEYLREI